MTNNTQDLNAELAAYNIKQTIKSHARYYLTS